MAGRPHRHRHLRAQRPPGHLPGAVPAQVAEFSAAGKYEDFTSAVSALDGALGLAKPGSTRILVIVSDGRYKGTQHADGQKLITRLAASGCLVIWIAPSDTASTMTGAKVVILDDPPPPARRSPAWSPPAPAPLNPRREAAQPASLPAPVPSPPSRAGKGHARTRARHRDKRNAKRKGDGHENAGTPKSESLNSARPPTGKLPSESRARVVMPGEDSDSMHFRARRPT